VNVEDARHVLGIICRLNWILMMLPSGEEVKVSVRTVRPVDGATSWSMDWPRLGHEVDELFDPADQRGF
jgi:hypothetical protein